MQELLDAKTLYVVLPESSNKRVLVTGGTGFLGSHVVDALRQRGYANLYVLRSAECDLRSQLATERFLNELQPEWIFHLAGNVGGIGANQARPAEFFYDNLMMGANIIHYGRQCEKIIMVGTTCSYPCYCPVPFIEENLWDGYPETTNAPYGIAKKSLLVMAQAYREQYGLNTIYLMPANLYGPRDHFGDNVSHVIPSLIKKYATSKSTVTLWGDGTPTREFLYVEDAAKGLVDAAERYNEPHPVNLGSGDEISIYHLAGQIAELVGFPGETIWDKSKPNGQPRRKLDTSRAFHGFGFRATTELRDGLERTIAWYRENIA